jgi:carbamoyl-phosphate synthase large subunit
MQTSVSPVLVTGAGGPAGVAVIRALRERRHTVVACDADPLAVGLRLADDAAVLPRSDEPNYIDQLCRLAEKTGSRMLVSTIAEEMPSLAAASAQLEAAGLTCWLPGPDAVHACLDKWLFAQIALAHALPIPPSGLGSAVGVPGPWVVKPRFGRGSRDVHMARNIGDLTLALARVPEPLVQNPLEGREFTLDVLVDRDGELAAAVPRWRLETRGGISVKGETFSAPTLLPEVTRLVRVLGLVGAANVQGFVHDDGPFTFVEVNPRFSGGLPLSIAAGADLVGEYLRGLRGLPLRRERLTFRPGVRMLRYFEEVYER